MDKQIIDKKWKPMDIDENGNTESMRRAHDHGEESLKIY